MIGIALLLSCTSLLCTLITAQQFTGPDYECPTGQFLYSKGDCRPCPIGTRAVGPNNPNFNERIFPQPFAPYPTCVFCPENTFNDLIGQGECKACPPGQYSFADTTTCSTRRRDSNIAYDQYYCLNRGLGAYNFGPFPSPAYTVSCQFCPTGFEVSARVDPENESGCIPCGPTRFRYGDIKGSTPYDDRPRVFQANTCTSCTLGTNDATCDSTNGVVTTCNDGFGLINGTCTICGTGTFSKNSLTCSNCSSTSFALPGSASCTECLYGTVPNAAKTTCVLPPCRGSGSTGLRGSAPLAPLAVGTISSSVVVEANICTPSTVTVQAASVTVQAATCSATVSVSVTTFTTTATVTITSLPTATGINSAVNQIQQVFTILITALNVQTKNAVIGITCSPSNINKSSDLWVCEV